MISLCFLAEVFAMNSKKEHSSLEMKDNNLADVYFYGSSRASMLFILQILVLLDSKGFRR
jgi:hypothetical protein